MELQEDCYDTLEIQQHIHQLWQKESQTLAARSYWIDAQKKDYALPHLASVVDYAFTNIPFYHEYYKSSGYEVGAIRSLADFESIPVLNKSILRNIQTKDFLPRKLAKDTSGMFWSSTSGSSGVALPILSDLDAVSFNSLTYYRMFQRLAGEEFSPDRWIYNIHHIRSWISSMAGDHPTFTLNDIASVEEFVQHMERLRPVILNLLPSYLPLLEPYAQRITNLRLKAIITNSEASSRHEREYFSSLYNAPVLDEYSSEEVGIIALECPYRHYHPEFDFAHVELNDFSTTADSTLATVYCTDFMCKTMPFIRYDHGDIVSVAGNDLSQCQCGQHGRTIERVEGRKDDCLKTLDGHYVPTAIVTNTLDSCFNANPNVSSFRLIQCATITDFKFIYTGASADLVVPAVSAFVTQLQNLLKMNIDVKIDRVDALPDTPSYKRKKIISEALATA
ncbi:MAG: hypothetical protein K2X80_20100 [Pseudomonadaceae bacterium]|nr:hypothetical protein [Pseudomonadaceae bacterium]